MAAVKLLPWQKRYINDNARRKFLAASVQVGKSFASSLECTLDVIENGGLWIMLSASDRQSIELMEKVRMHTAGSGVAVDSGFFEQTSIVQHTATFPNRGRIIALPANPDTARGYSGNVLLDEFAIHRDARAIWKAMVGRTLRGYKLRVLSSFKGKQNKFWELAKELGLHEGIVPETQPVKRGPWSGHLVTIQMAVAEGLQVDLDELRATVADEEVWLEEFCCVPMDSAADFIPLEMLLACESDEAQREWDGAARPELYAGFDIARKRDLSVIWILERMADLAVTRGVIWMDRMPFAEQLKVARDVARVVQRFAVDATGLGAMLAEELHGEFPWVEQVQFTAQVKERLAVELKRRVEERTLRLPSDARIRRAFQAVKRYLGPTGNVRFDAARTDAGHADEFWAAALANSAASEARNYVPASECEVDARTVMGNLMEATF